LSEALGCRDIKNVSIVRISGNDWMSVSPSSLAGIPAGKSVAIEFILTPRGEAVLGEGYSWTYEVRSSNANKVTIKLKARIIYDITGKLRNITSNLSKFDIPRGYVKAVDELIEAYRFSEKLGKDDYRNTLSVASKSQYVLEGIYAYLSNPDKNTSCLVLAGLNLRNIPEDISNISNSQLRNDVNTAYTHLKSFFEELARIEAEKYFEKGKENEGKNYLISAQSYRVSSAIYSIIDQKKAKEIHNLAEEMSKKFDEFVGKANDKRVEAMSLIDDARKLMQKVGNDYCILNPLNYDDVSRMYESAMGLYEDAIKDYEVAGELVLKDYASRELNLVKEEWKEIKLRFFVYLAILIVVFVLVTYRVVKGTLNYVSDVRELRNGDIVNP
jgi:tetratricopeptide (TPR) repeat protein